MRTLFHASAVLVSGEERPIAVCSSKKAAIAAADAWVASGWSVRSVKIERINPKVPAHAGGVSVVYRMIVCA